MQIDEKQIQMIDWDLRRRGISDCHLRAEIVDHICILMEEESGGCIGFKYTYHSIIKRFDSLKMIQIQTQKEVATTGWSSFFFRMTDYFFTLFYILLGLLCLILPISVIFYHPIDVFFVLCPLLIFGFIICFTRINYRKFELIPFRKNGTP